ncbi:lysine-specific histone demethylase 1-like protein 3, partial [Haematococcus lacustris]
MDREERRRFSACADKYARARSWLLCHDAGRSSFFTCAEALQECPKDLTPHLPTAYKFLAAHGRINFGLAPKPDQDQAQVPTPIVATDNDVPPDPVTPPNSLDQLVKELYAILRKVDWQVTTEKSIRKMLEEALGYSVQEHKALIKHH